MPAFQTRQYQAVTRIALPPLSRFICAPKPFARKGLSTPNTSQWIGKDPDLDFANYSSTGVIGDPTHASAELGARLWEVVVDDVAATLRSIANDVQTEDLVDVDKLHFLRRLQG